MPTDAPGGADPNGPERVPRDLADPLLEELGGWLDSPDPARVADRTRAWDVGTRAAARRLIAAHGLGPLLAGGPPQAPILAALPDDLRAWLAAQDERNRARIDRLHAELGAALRALNAAGVAAMPLKGSILTTRDDRDRYRRPMADLDILVRPADLAAARAALTGLGYRRRIDRTRRPTHDTFTRPGNDEVVSFDGEHPDNPRSIELHVEVKRHLWAWVDDDELTAFLWAGASAGSILGEPAILPTRSALLAHLAIHATSDLLGGRGRLIQWLELAEAAGAVDDLGVTSDMPHPRLAYPAVRLAARRLPRRLGAEVPVLAGLEALVPERLARWAATVPLDTHAGLQAARFGPRDMSSFGARLQRWAPSPWRLAVAYGTLPLPLATVRHVVRLAGMARRRSPAG